ncbi:PREDICTED: nucleolin 2-like [Camelina sativa]|uniref:Nucleolin 2-like n=1 Tax=Camelina sativa TaxID=90675 RepID=A0ABM0UVC5_CAMSA|nr:PREDICTED: nucleolin 2-like [Camelina sativa]
MKSFSNESFGQPTYSNYRKGYLFDSKPEVRAFFEKPRRSWVVDVEGFDTSLPEDEIREALTNHFWLCGGIVKVFLDDKDPKTDVLNSHATIVMVGDDAAEYVLELNGSELGGRKLVVKVKRFPGT